MALHTLKFEVSKEEAQRLIAAGVPFKNEGHEPEINVMNLMWYSLMRDRPCRFTAVKRDREELKKFRTIDELVAIIDQFKLEQGVTTAMNNNDIDFGYFPAIGEMFKENDELIFRMYQNDEGTEYMDIPVSDKDSEKTAMLIKYGTVYANVIMLGNQYTFLFLPGNTCEEDTFEIFMHERIPVFLEYANVQSLRDLGLLINQGQRLYLEFEEQYKRRRDYFERT